MCVCVCERERERERMTVFLSVCVYVCILSFMTKRMRYTCRVCIFEHLPWLIM